MSYPASVAKALAYLQAVDIPEHYKKIPPWYKFLWRKGVIAQPVILASFLYNALFFGIVGSILTAIIMRIINPGFWQPFIVGIIGMVIYAVIYGNLTTRYYQKQRQKFGLLSWAEIQNLPEENV